MVSAFGVYKNAKDTGNKKRTNKQLKKNEQRKNKTHPSLLNEKKKSFKKKNEKHPMIQIVKTLYLSGDVSESENNILKKDQKPKKTIAVRGTDNEIKINPIIKNEIPSAYIPARSHSIKDGKKLFKWVISPIGYKTFFGKFWEKTACLIKRCNENYFNKLISFEMIDAMLINNHIEFTKNIDITSYKNGIRETLNPEGRATPPVVWDYYANGCSIRLLNPQTFLDTIFALNTSLQELFHCMVGSNVYLTPPNSQGFAPHYDDIEAFVLQIEGRKRWKLYNSPNENELLPRNSSGNFAQNQLRKPFLEKVLMPGDMLYFPRGTIHQALTEPGFHSVHITLSVYQKQSYADLFEKMFPMILQRAIEENVEFRRGLPLNVWHNAGIVYSDNSTGERNDFVGRCRDLIAKSLKKIPIDQAVDQLAKKFQHEALPPNITEAEKYRTVFGSKNAVDTNGIVGVDYSFNLITKVRLLRANIMRLVEEDAAIRVYYYVDNSKEYCEYDPNYIEIESECASSIEVLIKSYPTYLTVNELPLEDKEQKIGIVTTLWERGLLMVDKPFS